MILQEVAHKVQSHGLGQAAVFTFALNAKSFRQTMSGMYSRPIEAIMREYTANAYDATRDAELRFGKPFRPPIIHLPTQLNPVWSCRDFGTGMSHEFMMTDFVQMYNSTKDRTNDFIGSFGIGSKSFFAYTDQAIFTVWHNGRKRIYNCHLAADGLPMISVMADLPSDEPTGVQVEFGVKQQDFKLFKEAAEKVFGRFDPMPELRGWPVAPKRVEYVTKGNGWAMRKSGGSSYYSHADEAYAIQGFIAYPLKSAEMEGLSQREKLIFQLPIDIYFDIGELEVTTSREDLMYTDFTKVNIRRKLQEVAADLCHDLQIELNKCPTKWEAIRFMGNKRKELNPQMWAVWSNEARYKGEKIGIQASFAQKNCQTPRHPVPDVTIVELTAREMSLVVPKFKEQTDLHFYPEDNTWVVWDDRKVIRYRSVLEHNGMRDKHLILIRTEHRDVFNKALEMIGNPPFDILSELPEPPKVERDPSAPKRKRNMQKVFEVVGYIDNYPRAEPCTIDVSLGGTYIRTYNSVPNDFPSWSDLGLMTRKAAKLGISLPAKLYSFPATHKHIPERNEGWVEYRKWLDEQLVKKVEELNWRQIIADDIEARRLRNKWGVILFIAERAKTCKTLIELSAKYRALLSYADVQSLREILQWLRPCGLDPEKPGVKPTHDVTNIVEKLVAKHPMLAIVQDHVGTYRLKEDQIATIEKYLLARKC